MKGNFRWLLGVSAALLAVSPSFAAELDVGQNSNVFSIIILPDTQNTVDYKHQKAEGFAIDGSEMFLKQMQEIADKSFQNGGNLAFVASVGDVWQHPTIPIDQDHKDRGFGLYDVPDRLRALIEITDKTITYELPLVREGYRFFTDAGLPFGVIPGNHDYDASWYESRRMVHLGGLENFLSVFAEDGEFFLDKPWYLEGYQGGTSNAQIFTAGDYTFLNLSFEMQPSDGVLEWAQRLVDLNPGLPTIITTHDYLNEYGERKPTIADLAIVDPDYHNSAQQMWDKFIRQNDQIFMVISGHHRGQFLRVDLNDAGHEVYQVMVDYQDRGQAGLDAGEPLSFRGTPMSIGDAWYRIMDFNLEAAVPFIEMSTYSSHYEAFSSELETYATWYKELEQPEMTDSEFFDADEFRLTLSDFYERFSLTD